MTSAKARPTYRGMNVDDYARDVVKRNVERGITVEQFMDSQWGRFGDGLRVDVGSGFHWDRDAKRILTKTKRGEMFVQIDDEWKVFNLHKLYEEAMSGAIQAELL